MDNNDKATGYQNYSDWYTAELTSEYKTFSKEFTMNKDTDDTSRFNVSLGAIDGGEITTAHIVCIDDVVLEEIQ